MKLNDQLSQKIHVKESKSDNINKIVQQLNQSKAREKGRKNKYLLPNEKA